MKRTLSIVSLVVIFASALFAQTQNPAPGKPVAPGVKPAAAKTDSAKPAAAKTDSAKPNPVKPDSGKSEVSANEPVADTESADDKSNDNEKTITVRNIIVKGGWVMYAIAGLSFLAIALAIFYFFTMRKSILCPKRFILDAKDYAENGDIEGLQDLCMENGSAASKIVSAAIEQIVPGQAFDYNRLREAMEDEGGRQAGILWQRLQYLMDVAIISPMVGLLGTVWGMMVSFAGIESGADFAKKAETMANGIAQAMYTTFGGLIVGIFAMALYDLLRGHLNKLTSALESSCMSILRRMAPADGKSTASYGQHLNKTSSK